MNRLLLIVTTLIFSASSIAEEISVLPRDCGPLDRSEYGVVFRVDVFPKGQTYFAKGKASTLCPMLLSGKPITGTEAQLPESEIFSESERVVIKEFILNDRDES